MQISLGAPYRWILVLPSAVFAFVLVLFITVGIRSAINHMCPGIESGGSGCPQWLAMFPFDFGIIAAPALVVLFGAWMAPVHRATVSWLLVGLGLLAAGFLIPRGSPHFLPWMAILAVSGGVVSLMIHGWSYIRHRRK